MPQSLSELFAPERIKTNLEAEDKPEVFEELVDFLALRYGLSCKDRILEAICRREEKMSTGIKRGIAIPHAKIDVTKGIIGVLGISRKGIDYESLDGEPVRLLFLLVSSESAAVSHLSALKRIALLADVPDFYTQMLAAETPEEANQIIARHEAGLAASDV